MQELDPSAAPLPEQSRTIKASLWQGWARRFSLHMELTQASILRGMTWRDGCVAIRAPVDKACSSWSSDPCLQGRGVILSLLMLLIHLKNVTPAWSCILQLSTVLHTMRLCQDTAKKSGHIFDLALFSKRKRITLYGAVWRCSGNWCLWVGYQHAMASHSFKKLITLAHTFSCVFHAD